MTAGDTGILLNNRMAYRHLEPGHPNFLRPGRRVRHTMNPPLVLKDGKLWGVFGTPGADNQVQVNFQIATAMIDFGLDPQQAAEMPRWSSMVPGQYADYPHDGPDVLTMERRFPEEVWRDSSAEVTRSTLWAISTAPAASRSSGVRTLCCWPGRTPLRRLGVGVVSGELNATGEARV